MKTSLTAKIVIVLCILCLIAGFLTLDKYEPYESEHKKIKSNKAAVIELNGVITSESENKFFDQNSGAINMLKSLVEAKEDKNISGVILKINSPGGTVAMSQNIYNKIMDVRTVKPVISVFDDVGASGAYYIASASDRIIAQEGSLVGSIGVIFSYLDYHNLLANKLDVNNVVIKSGKFKDIGSPTREMTEEERVLMQDIVDDSYNQFLSAIRNGRINRASDYNVEKTILTEETLSNYADGRVFTGRQAQKLGFIDKTGDMDTAKAMISSMMQQKFNNNLPVSLVLYNKQNNFFDYMKEFTEYRFNSGMNIADFMPKSMILNRRPLYLWE